MTFFASAFILNKDTKTKDTTVTTNADTKVLTKSKTKVKVLPPKEHKVIYLNDDITPMDFVIQSLVDIFDHDDDTAEILTTRVHEEGSAVVAVLPYEMAEHKGVEVTVMARANGFPLTVKIEPE